MTSSELYSGLRWLGISPAVASVHALVTRLDSDADGLLSCDDFVAGFAQGDPTADTTASTVTPGQQELFIPLQRIPELHVGPGGPGSPGGPGGGGGGRGGPVISLSASELSQFVAALKVCGGHTQVVSQAATAGGEAAFAIVAPSATGVAKGGSLTVPLGHYALGAGAEAEPPRLSILELRDTRGGGGGITGIWGDSSGVRLYAALDQILPPPARFQVVWSRGGAQPLTIWSAVPPTNDFVALGMVATATTSTSARPPLDVIRCVPKAWVRRAEAGERVYSGVEGSLWRSRHGLLHASKGKHAPQVYEVAGKAELSLVL
jgi:hypothetical protein